jgi:hypothetical protein
VQDNLSIKRVLRQLAMPQVSIPSHLVPFLTSQETSAEQATDALEEWILFRRGKGDTLFEVSVGLAELEDKVRRSHDVVKTLKQKA